MRSKNSNFKRKPNKLIGGDNTKYYYDKNNIFYLPDDVKEYILYSLTLSHDTANRAPIHKLMFNVFLETLETLHQPKRKMGQDYLFLYILKLCFR